MSEFIGSMIIPSADDVRYGIGEGSGGVESTGNFILPAESSVLKGIGYGSNATELSGIFICPIIQELDLFISAFDNLTANIDLFIDGDNTLTNQIDLFVRGITSGIIPPIGNDNFGLTLDQLFKSGDFNPQIIGRFITNPSSVTIEIWDNNGNIIILTSNNCYQISDTGRWAWSTINLSPLTKVVSQFIYRMTGDNLETFESQFILNIRRKNNYNKIPRDNSQIRKV